jgi:hypothetical protein
MLIIHPVFNLISHILPRDPQGQLRSYKLLSRTASCELIGDFVSLYPSMSRDPIQPHSVPGRGVVCDHIYISYYYSDSPGIDPRWCHLGFFPWFLPTKPCALRLTQPLKMSTRDFSWGKGGQCVWLTTYHPCSAESRKDLGP